ncbi:MAG: leucine-rich repeat-containing protein [Crocinitomicaceae bacterium]|jgi:Leucine-rich repeat (LRR) protein|nr:leucine-rich repeat-containing protein [Crocinitomicaceae bacterium]
MNWKSALFWLLLLTERSFAQSGLPVYSWEQAKNYSPDTVYSISFHKMKLEALPEDLAKFTRLKKLDISSNKLKTLPAFLAEFQDLEEIDFSKNKFTDFPEVLFQLQNLRKLSFNRNVIALIPENISALKKLEYIDFWDNPIARFPEAFTELPALKTIHAEGIKYGPKFQQRWITNLPDCNIFFDPPCDCVEE